MKTLSAPTWPKTESIAEFIQRGGKITVIANRRIRRKPTSRKAA